MGFKVTLGLGHRATYGSQRVQDPQKRLCPYGEFRLCGEFRWVKAKVTPTVRKTKIASVARNAKEQQ